MRTLFILLPLGALSACQGLYLTQGNAYPCDFSQGPGVRDAVCIEGDVCGTNNVCQKYIYEGPRFEGAATVPSFDAGAFVLVHPGALDGPVTQLAISAGPRTSTFIQLADGGSFLSSPRGQLGPSRQLELGVDEASLFTVRNTLAITGISAAGTLSYWLATPGSSVSVTTGTRARRLRATSTLTGPVLQAVTSDDEAGEVTLVQPPPPPIAAPPELQVTRLYAVDGGALDVALLTRPPAKPTPVVLTRTGLWLGEADGGFEEVTSHLPDAPAQLRLNAAGTVLVELHARVLSTWQVGLSDSIPRTHTLEQPWADCTPCGLGATLEGATPLPPSQGLGVEVLCRSPQGGRTLLKVTGSDAVEAGDLCEAEEFPLPLDDSQLNLAQGKVVSASSQRGVVAGGKNGEVWSGDTFSDLLPRGLDRVPFDVMQVELLSGGVSTPSLAALTDRYFAVLQTSSDGGRSSGFRRVDTFEDFSSSGEVRLLAGVRGVAGWALQTNGVVAQLTVADDQDAGLAFGPRLVSPAGEPIRRSSGGEAFVQLDGGLTALFLTADDGLYFVADPLALGDLSSGTRDLSPQLQPEPSVPIRSLALERTPLGTDGVERARGYLVTSRNVFEWSLGGSPARWSSQPLLLAGGEPVEVWFDQERSALGRVGYSDGRIFTLPGGYQLANALPGEDGGVVQLLDYENFGGWPVALATNGLFVAGWPQDANGKLLNRFADGGINRPMDWRELTLPDGSRPWLTSTRGRLAVSSQRSAGLRTFRLFVFLDHQVWQLGEYTRTSK